MLEEKIKDYLKEHLSERRYNHTLGVCQSAIELAKLYGEDIEKAKIAALIHDMAKEMPIKDQKAILEANGFNINEDEENSPQILHGFVASILGKSIFNITDEEILSSVYYHSTGKREMTKLEKIVYLADYIEPGRIYPGVDELREVSKKSLDEGVLMGLNNTIKLVIDNRGVIHPLTLEARNYLIINLKK